MPYQDPLKGKVTIGYALVRRIADTEALINVTADRIFEKLLHDATQKDFVVHREDFDLHVHKDEPRDCVHVILLWNPVRKDKRVELVGGPQDGLDYYLSDPDRDTIIVDVPGENRGLLAAIEPDAIEVFPVKGMYRRWKVNSASRCWAYKFEQPV